MLLAVLVVVCIVFALIAPGFGTVGSLDNILVVAVPVALLAMGESLAIYSGGIDLSVGAMLGLGGMSGGAIMSGLYHGQTGTDIGLLLLGLAVALAVGLVGGLFNGFVIGKLRLEPLIVTLGTLGIFGGAADLISGGEPLSSFPPSSFALGNGKVLGAIPILVVIGIVVLFLFLFIERMTTLGRHIFALGANRDALVRAGVTPNSVMLWVYAFAGVAAAFAGFLEASRFQTATPIAGQNTLLLGVAAVVIGGAPLTGGEGTVLGAGLGAILISVLENGFVELGLQSYWQVVAVGALVIVAVYVSQVQQRRKTFGYRRRVRAAGPTPGVVVDEPGGGEHAT